MFTVKSSIFHLQCVILSETVLGKNAEVAKNSNIFQLFGLFQCSVTRSRVAHAEHQAIKNQEQSVLCACVQFQHSSLLCYERSVELQNLVKMSSGDAQKKTKSHTHTQFVATEYGIGIDCPTITSSFRPRKHVLLSMF
jgi:hypothetical protein